VGFGGAKKEDPAGVACTNNHALRSLCRRQCQALLRLEMAYVGIAAVVLDAVNMPAIAADGEQSVGASTQSVDDIVLA